MSSKSSFYTTTATATEMQSVATSAANAATSEANALASKNAAETAKTAAETAQAASETARTQSQTAQAASETARDASVTAKTASESARDTASTHASTATTKAGEASTSASSASGSASTATTQAGLASDHRADAGKYAVTNHNTTFSLSSTNGGTSGLYSAKHYATEAANSATSAANTAASIGTLDSLSDVTITSVADNEIVAYDSSSSKFINQTAAEAGLLTGNETITLSGDVSGSGTTSIAVTIADDSHNHIIGNVDGLQTALDAKAPLASPALTGNPTAPTQSASDNSTKIATTAYVDAQVATENTIAEMDDVTITSIGDNEILQYNNSTSKFENQTLAEAGILTGNQTITLSGDVSGSGTTSIAVTIADDSHNHTIANVDNLQTSLDAKAPLASPALTGNPTAPTQSASDNSTKIATTAYTDTAISNLVDSSPAALNTLNELAAALGDDANFSTTVTNSLATKAPLASPSLTGTPTAPTASGGTNTTQIATTAFVTSATSNKATKGFATAMAIALAPFKDF